jgi:hypothetical protein
MQGDAKAHDLAAVREAQCGHAFTTGDPAYSA